MQIKKVGNKYRKVTWVDFLKSHCYEVGTVIVGLAVFVMGLLIIKGWC